MRSSPRQRHSCRRVLRRDSLADHLDRLHREARALCRSREDAEDLVQETCLRLLARRRVLRGAEDAGYLLTALRNTFVDMRRTQARRPVLVTLDRDDLAVAPGGRGSPERALHAGEVTAAIAALPRGFRDVLVAVDVVGLTYGEAAAALGTPPGTVMSRLHRARGRVIAATGPPPADTA